MDKIAIFCSASDNIDPVYFDKARELGTWMGQNGKTLIYGGANIGLMECVARAAKENGSMVMGVVPTKLEDLSYRQSERPQRCYVARSGCSGGTAGRSGYFGRNISCDGCSHIGLSP